MRFIDAMDAIRHAAFRALTTGEPWGVYWMDRYIAAPLGRISADQLLEVCQP